MKQFQCSAVHVSLLHLKQLISLFQNIYLLRISFAKKNNLKLLADFFLVLEANDDSLPSISERIACHDKSQKN